MMLLVLPVFIFLSFGSCKKDKQSNSSASKKLADPVDTIIGTYTGTMHVTNINIVPHNSLLPLSSSNLDTSQSDTSYMSSFVFSKVSADSFNTGGLFCFF